MLKIIIMVLAALLINVGYATTLRNVEPIEVIKKSDKVALIRVIEAKYKEIEYEEEDGDTIQIPYCSIDVKAKILQDYFSGSEKIVQFSTNGSIEVGENYLAFLKNQDSEQWFKSSWWEFTPQDEELDKQSKKCLADTFLLKGESFPQRIIKIDFEGYLEFDLNNMLIPKEVEIKVDNKNRTVIQQYNDTRVKFEDFDNYLKELISKNKKDIKAMN